MKPAIVPAGFKCAVCGGASTVQGGRSECSPVCSGAASEPLFTRADLVAAVIAGFNAGHLTEAPHPVESEAHSLVSELLGEQKGGG